MSGESWQKVFSVLRQPRLRQVYAASVLGVMLDRVRNSELNRLVQAGLLTATNTGYQVNESVYERVLAAEQPAKPRGAERYLRVERLRQLPARAQDRVAVLRRVAELLFEPGRHYGEGEVTMLLRVIGDDVPGLCQALLDEGLLNRDPVGPEYWLA